ncbi:tetratricopeptide repeat protein [Thermodesulfobacteriota bacterium]
MIDIKEMSVLIADDMENMYNSIRSIMRLLHFGRKFTYVPNGEEALKALKEGFYDLAMLDNNMPIITGLELLEIIRSDRQLRHMPVIMITGHAYKEFITNAAESDVDAYVLKPITVNLLKEKVPMVIEKANNPPPMMLHLKKALAFEEDGNLAGAVEETLLAMQANPKSTRPLRDAGYYFLKSGDLEEAERYLLRAAEMNPLDVIAFNHLGDLYLLRDDVDQALKYFNKAVEISPRHYERGLNLGRLLVKKNMPDKAEKVFTKVFELAKNRLAAQEEVADYCIENGALEYGMKLLRGLVEQNRERGDLIVKLGTLLAQAGKGEEALRYLEEAVFLQPNNVEVKVQIAKIYLSQGMLIRAEKPLKAVLDLDPDHKEARELMRQCI